MTPDRLIPLALKPLTNLTGDDDRPALAGIHVTQNTKGRDVYEVTDGNQLVRATVVETQKPEDFPDTVIAQMPGTRVNDTIIPAGAWDAAMKSAPKRSHMPILNTVACVVRDEKGKKAITLATTDLETPRVTQTQPVDATPYSVKNVYPEGKPVASVTMDAHLLARVFKTWAAICGGRLADVQIDVFKGHTPIRLSAWNEDRSIHLSGLIMPCHPDLERVIYADPDEMASTTEKKPKKSGKEPLP